MADRILQQNSAHIMSDSLDLRKVYNYKCKLDTIIEHTAARPYIRMLKHCYFDVLPLHGFIFKDVSKNIFLLRSMRSMCKVAKIRFYITSILSVVHPVIFIWFVNYWHDMQRQLHYNSDCLHPCHDDVTMWKRFGHRWIRFTNGQWGGYMMFSVILVCANYRTNRRVAGDFRRHDDPVTSLICYIPFNTFQESCTHFQDLSRFFVGQ